LAGHALRHARWPACQPAQAFRQAASLMHHPWAWACALLLNE